VDRIHLDLGLGLVNKAVMILRAVSDVGLRLEKLGLCRIGSSHSSDYEL
jgi:hypothetical protein